MMRVTYFMTNLQFPKLLSHFSNYPPRSNCC